MSCRVIGRKVETAILAQIMRRAPERRGAAVLWGWFIPTAKNAPAAQFYPKSTALTAAVISRDANDQRSAWQYGLTTALDASRPTLFRVAGRRFSQPAFKSRSNRGLMVSTVE